MNTTLIYNGAEIRDRGEILCLTDMWKAAGSDESKRPIDWLRLPGTQEFVSWVAESLNMADVGKSHFGLVETKRGGNEKGGSTWAHWQIGMAYAKYLSPEFHAWCNSVVRDHMQGRLNPPNMQDMLRSLLRETVSETLTQMVPSIIEARLATDPRVALSDDYISTNDLLIEMGADQRGRRDLGKMVTHRLKRACDQLQVEPRHDRRGVLLFPRSIISNGTKRAIEALVKAHNDFAVGQERLALPAPNRRRALAKVAVADAIIDAAREGLAAVVFGGELIFFDTTADDVEEGAEVVAVLNTSIGGAGRFVPCIAGERQPGYGPLARPVHGPHVRSAFPLIYRVAGPIVGRQPLHKAA